MSNRFDRLHPELLRFRWLTLLILLVFITGCMPPGEDSDVPGSEGRGNVRDFPAMMKAKYGHQACTEHTDCPFGTRCDGDTETCTYDCAGDSGCDGGRVCSDLGTCVLGFRPYLASTDATCTSKTDASKLATLVHIFNKATDEQGVISCHNDSMCPCGGRMQPLVGQHVDL
jgi:hypothetical protein